MMRNSFCSTSMSKQSWVSLSRAFFSTAAEGWLYSLPLNEFLHSSPEAPRTIQVRETSASEGRKLLPRNLASKYGIYESTGFFYMPQSWDMGQVLSLPLRRMVCWGLFGYPKNPTASNPRIRVPEASMLTTRLPKPQAVCADNAVVKWTDLLSNIS